MDLLYGSLEVSGCNLGKAIKIASNNLHINRKYRYITFHRLLWLANKGYHEDRTRLSQHRHSRRFAYGFYIVWLYTFRCIMDTK